VTEKVYVIGSPGATVVKIGYSKDPQRRLGSLQSGSQLTLSVLATFEGGKPLKVALHERFAAFAHGLGNPCEITFFPECFVWFIENMKLWTGLSLGKYFSALTLQPFNALTPQ